MKKYFLLLIVLFNVIYSYAQEPAKESNFEKYIYSCNLSRWNKDLRHMPLDGEKVSIIPYRKGEKYGFVDKQTGKLVIPYIYNNVYQVFEEGAVLGGGSIRDEDLLLINNTGDTIIQVYRQSLLRKENGLIHIMFPFNKQGVPETKNGRGQVLVLDSKFKKLIDIEVNDYNFFSDSDSIAWFRLGPDVSIINRRGEIVKKLKYTEQKQFTGIRYNHLSFIISRNDSTFYVLEDLEGRRIISFQQFGESKTWNGPYPISENLYGFIDDEGTIVFKDSTGIVFPYSAKYNIHNNTTAPEITNFMDNGIFNSNYNFYWDEYSEVVPKAAYYAVQHRGKYGIINNMGKIIIPDTFDFVQIIDNNKFLLMNQDEQRQLHYYYSSPAANIEAYSLIDSSKKTRPFIELYKASSYHTLISNPYSHFLYSDGYSTITPQYYFQYYHLRTHKKHVLPKEYIGAENFDNGLALVVNKQNRIGFIDTTYQLVISCKYPMDGIASSIAGMVWSHKFVNGYCYISALKGYIDIRGKEYFEGEFKKRD